MGWGPGLLGLREEGDGGLDLRSEEEGAGGRILKVVFFFFFLEGEIRSLGFCGRRGLPKTRMGDKTVFWVPTSEGGAPRPLAAPCEVQIPGRQVWEAL